MLARKIRLNEQQSFLICSLETLCHKDRDIFSSRKKIVLSAAKGFKSLRGCFYMQAI